MAVSKIFAHRLKQLRNIAELNQTQLAESLGISRGSVSYYENCERIPDIEILDRVSDFFNVSLDFLLGYSDNINKDYAEVGTLTGLSDKAVDILINEGVNTDLLSNVIEDENFIKFMDLFGYFCYTYNNINKFHEEPRVRNNEYISYLLTGILMEILENVALKENGRTRNELIAEKGESKSFEKDIRETVSQLQNETQIEFEKYLKTHQEELNVQEKIYKHFNMGDEK